MERKYYENPKHWVPDHYYSGPEAIRRQTTLAWIPKDVETICDVGCGNGTLTNQFNKSHFAVGIDRSLSALRWVDKNSCQADIVSLPFADNSFDLVVSTEVIEHLPYNAYFQGLSEIVRIAKSYILMSVPYNEDLELMRVKCPQCRCKFHSNYHMRDYKSEDIKSLFNRWNYVKLIKAEGIAEIITPLFYRGYIIARRVLLGGKANFPRTALCPQCGYSSELKAGTIQEDSIQNIGQTRTKTLSPKSLIKLLWPRQKKFRWWLALYEKQL